MRDAPGVPDQLRPSPDATPGRPRLRTELLLAATLFLLADLAIAATQPLIAVNGGKGYDGSSYDTVAQQIAAGQRPVEEAPFVYRLGTPFLAAAIAPRDLFAGFVIVNAAANALTAMVFFLWLRPFIPDLRIRLALLASFVLMWHGPIRFFHFYPVSAEHLTYAVNMLGLAGAYALRDRISLRLVAGLTLLAIAGAAIRETALLAMAAVPFVRDPLRIAWRVPTAPIVLFAPIVAGAIALVAVHGAASQTNDFGFARAIIVWLTEKSPLVYALGWWIGYGPLLALPIIAWRSSLTFLASHQLLAAFVGACAVLGWVGGQDTERYVYWAAPVVLVLVGQAIPELLAGGSRALVAVLIAAQAVAERVFLAIPQPLEFDPTTLDRDRHYDSLLLLTPVGGRVDYFDLWSFWMPRMAKVIVLGEYVVLFVLVAAAIRWQTARTRRSGSAPIA
jgi:hypothetical protein